MSKQIRIVEVGLRDGLQNEKMQFSLKQKAELFERVVKAGEKNIELGSFVSPKWIPQMADSMELIQSEMKKMRAGNFPKGLVPSALVPNLHGMEDAIRSGIPEVAIFAACSESFSQKNINCSIDESFERFIPVMKLAKKHKLKVRGYLSVCFACPYEGPTPMKKVVELTKRMLKLGVYEVSIGDTIGVANPVHTEKLIKMLSKIAPKKKLAMHFHDTRGMALANILASLKLGITIFDASVGGLGGCPYAKGATGNVATEDVVNMLHEMGYQTGIDLKHLVQTAKWLELVLGRPVPSKLSRISN